jgi:hypothetical protein
MKAPATAITESKYASSGSPAGSVLVQEVQGVSQELVSMSLADTGAGSVDSVLSRAQYT